MAPLVTSRGIGSVVLPIAACRQNAADPGVAACEAAGLQLRATGWVT